jgi:hypothetical protein
MLHMADGMFLALAAAVARLSCWDTLRFQQYQMACGRFAMPAGRVGLCLHMARAWQCVLPLRCLVVWEVVC